MRLVMALATEGGQLTIRSLSEREGLPDATVAKIIGRLRHAGILRAERGRHGGYTLSRPASDVTLANVVEAFDQKVFDPSFCNRMTRDGADCAHIRDCGLRPVLSSLTSVIGNFLSQITVADLIDGEVPARRSLPTVVHQTDTTVSEGAR